MTSTTRRTVKRSGQLSGTQTAATTVTTAPGTTTAQSAARTAAARTVAARTAMARTTGHLATLVAAASGLTLAMGATPASASPLALTATTLTIAKDGSGNYTSVQAAVNSVSSGNSARVNIDIKPGTYREQVTIPSNKPYLTLNGTGDSPDDVLIVNNKNAGSYGTQGSAPSSLRAMNSRRPT